MPGFAVSDHEPIVAYAAPASSSARRCPTSAGVVPVSG